MREIKFRGKRIDNGEWVYGGIKFFRDEICIICPHGNTADFNHEVIPETVGQYIGFNEALGEKLFYNDIIEVCVFFTSPYNVDDDNHFRGVIVDNEGKVSLKVYYFMCNNDKGWQLLKNPSYNFPFDIDLIEEDGTFTIPLFDLCAMSNNLGEYNSDNVALSGNIHDNPELLT